MSSQKNTLTETKSTMIEDTIKERTESYGDFTDNATVAQLLKDDNGLLGGDEDDLPTEPLSFTKWREGLGYEESSHPDYDYNLRGMCYGHSSVYGMYKEYLDARLNNDGKSTKVDES